MTPKVTKRIRSRPGKAAPESVVSGIARAAASDTAPRIPAQELTIRSRQVERFAFLRWPAVDQAQQHGRPEAPGEADRDHDQRGEQRVPGRLAGTEVGVAEAVDDLRQLQPDQDEERRVEQEGEDFPDGLGLQPGLRALQFRRAVAEVEAAGDGGEDAERPS